MTSKHLTFSKAIRGPFTFTAIGVSIAWVVGCVVLLSVASLFSGDFVSDTILISVLSGLIALASLTFGMVREWVAILEPKDRQDTKVKKDYIVPLFGGMILRLIATVALFIICSYQVAGSVEWIALVTIGWYVFLTTIEVVLLSSRIVADDEVSSNANTTVNCSSPTL